MVGAKEELVVDSTKDLTILMMMQETMETMIRMLMMIPVQEDANLLTCPQLLELQVVTKKKKRRTPDLLPLSQLSEVKLTLKELVAVKKKIKITLVEIVLMISP